MIVLVERILVQHIPALKQYDKLVVKHIKHAHSKETCLKSEIVSVYTDLPPYNRNFDTRFLLIEVNHFVPS